jgi:hypothetical protein
MFWNENLAVQGAVIHGDVTLWTRSGDFLDITGLAPSDTDGGVANAWEGPLTEPSGTLIPSLPANYFQFQVRMTTDDSTGIYFPWLYKAEGFVTKATFWKLEVPAESALTFRYQTGYRNFDLPFADKIFRKVVSVHEGEGTFNLRVYLRPNPLVAIHTFTIDMTVNPNRWVSNFPPTVYGPDISLEWYKNDNEVFNIKQYGITMEPTPLI